MKRRYIDPEELADALEEAQRLGNRPTERLCRLFSCRLLSCRLNYVNCIINFFFSHIDRLYDRFVVIIFSKN